MTSARVLAAVSLLLAASCGSHPPIVADDGAPSADYPVSHEPIGAVAFLGGPVQHAPVFYSVTVAGDPYATQLADFLTKLSASTYWTAAVGSYGVGAGSFGGAVTIPAPAATITTQGLKDMLQPMLDGTHAEYGTPSLDSNYIVYLPDGVTISDGSGTSCVDYGAYHGSMVIASGPFAGVEVTYSAMPRCSPQGWGFPTQLDELTFATSHEIAEAASDPSVEDGRYGWAGFGARDAAWNILTGGEVGDMCNFYSDSADVTPADVGYVVQRIWSKSAAAASHDPCQPSSRVYFGASPVLPDATGIPAIGASNAPTVIIPVGGSREIDLELFSDGPTGAFTVAPVDAAPGFGFAANLSFQLDRKSGVNGEKLHLTIHVKSAGQYGLGDTEFFWIVSTLDGRHQVWPVMVVNH